MHNQLEIREIFHIEFLRWFARKIKPGYYAVKGGTNLRLFFNSIRYSEDMDLDAQGITVVKVEDAVDGILRSSSFQDSLRPFGIERITPPDMSKAKQTQTTQRFKIHLLASSGEDLFTKIEFSRRGFKGTVLVQTVPDSILRVYKAPPLFVPHYDIQSAIRQKVEALAMRSVIQARDIFDIFILSPQCDKDLLKKIKIDHAKLRKAYENVFEIGFGQFRDTVLSYLSYEDMAMYDSSSAWDEVKLKTAHFIDELKKGYV